MHIEREFWLFCTFHVLFLLTFENAYLIAWMPLTSILILSLSQIRATDFGQRFIKLDSFLNCSCFEMLNRQILRSPVYSDTHRVSLRVSLPSEMINFSTDELVDGSVIRLGEDFLCGACVFRKKTHQNLVDLQGWCHLHYGLDSWCYPRTKLWILTTKVSLYTFTAIHLIRGAPSGPATVEMKGSIYSRLQPQLRGSPQKPTRTDTPVTTRVANDTSDRRLRDLL